MFEMNNFDAIRIGLASPEKSGNGRGRGKKAGNDQLQDIETERDGLFCEGYSDRRRTGNVTAANIKG